MSTTTASFKDDKWTAPRILFVAPDEKVCTGNSRICFSLHKESQEKVTVYTFKHVHPVRTRRHFNVHPTSIQRYGRCMDVETTLRAYTGSWPSKTRTLQQVKHLSWSLEPLKTRKLKHLARSNIFLGPVSLDRSNISICQSQTYFSVKVWAIESQLATVLFLGKLLHQIQTSSTPSVKIEEDIQWSCQLHYILV